MPRRFPKVADDQIIEVECKLIFNGDDLKEAIDYAREQELSSYEDVDVAGVLIDAFHAGRINPDIEDESAEILDEE